VTPPVRAMAPPCAGNCEAELRQRQMAGIVDAALEAIIAVDGQHRIVLFNRAAARMFGVSPPDALGSDIERFLPVRFRAAHAMHMGRFAAEGQTTRHMGRTREVTGRRANGDEFPLEASIARVGEGAQMLMVVTARDVTQLRQAELAQLARIRAEASERAKTELLARVSHELRTPLNAVLGFAQVMRADAGDPLSAGQAQQIDRVLQAAAELRGLIDEVLRAAHGEVAPAPAAAAGLPPTGPRAAATAGAAEDAAPPSGLVLYIEDNPVNAMLVEQLLARWPAVRLVVAEDGATGLAQALALNPDVVLLDMQLPDMEGLQVLQRLKAGEATRAMPVVVLSANAVPDDMQAARDAGALDYWTKPVDLDGFLAGMRPLLARGGA
jgi:PAS domain S-box-containing protein